MKNGSVKNTSALPFTGVFPAECTRNSISRTQNCLLLHTRKFLKSLCTQVWRNMTIMWNTKWVRACLAIWGSQQSLGFPWSSCSCEPQSSSAETLWTHYFLPEQHGQLTKCSFCIVFKWIFRNANFILWWIWAFTKCLIEKHLSLRQCSVFC